MFFSEKSCFSAEASCLMSRKPTWVRYIYVRDAKIKMTLCALPSRLLKGNRQLCLPTMDFSLYDC